jgi:hypothetical protein
LCASFPSSLVLFFSTAKRKEPKPACRQAGKAPPFASSLLEAKGQLYTVSQFAVQLHGAAIFPIVYQMMGPNVSSAFYLLSGHGSHIYGNMKAPSLAERICIIEHFPARVNLNFIFLLRYFLSSSHFITNSLIINKNVGSGCASCFPLLPKNCAPFLTSCAGEYVVSIHICYSVAPIFQHLFKLQPCLDLGKGEIYDSAFSAV